MSKPVSVVIREMTKADISAVANIARSAMPFPWSVQVFEDCLKAHYHAWVMTEASTSGDHAVIGFGIVLLHPPECQLMNICVQPGHQNQGYGGKILKYMVDFARENGAIQMMLEVRKSNRAAISIYRSQQFIEIGERKYYYPAERGREDAIILVRHLTGE